MKGFQRFGPGSRRKILRILMKLLVLLIALRLREFRQLLRRILFRMTSWQVLKPESVLSNHLLMLQSMLELAKELQLIVGEGLVAELMTQFIYKADRKFDVLAAIAAKHTDDPQPGKHNQRLWPDRNRESFIKIGKCSQSLPPPVK